MNDLQGALLGYRDLDNARHRVMLNVTQAITDAHTVADLARGVVEALSCLQGISVGFFGRPDATGRLRMEIGAGTGLAALADEGPGGPAGRRCRPRVDEAAHGPAEVAWRSGTIERCDSYAMDRPRHRARRRPVARRGAAPRLALQRGHPVGRPARFHDGAALLHARWPGYFASDAVMTMLRQIKQSLESALSEIEERPTLASGVSGYADRVSHIARLRTGAVRCSSSR